MMGSVIWDCLRVEARDPLLLPMPLQQQQISLDHPSRIQTQIALQQLFVCTLISTIIIIGVIFFVIVPKHKSSDSGASHAQI
jgi:hypothetical protein